jgi:alanine dehydrogenase
MIIGIPREIKRDENRVAMTPAGVDVLRRHGHEVLVETGAGIASGFADDSYADVGARIIDAADDIFNLAEMLLRVKEPQPSEADRLRENQIYLRTFTWPHPPRSPVP